MYFLWLQVCQHITISIEEIIVLYVNPRIFIHRHFNIFYILTYSKDHEDKIIKDDIRCEENELNGYQYCLCNNGYKLARISSHHDNRHEDRQWSLICEFITPTFDVIDSLRYPRESNNGLWTKFDEPINFVAANQVGYSGFIVGMKSHHDNNKEDRSFIFYFTTIDSRKWEINNCSWEKMNRWDEDMDFRLSRDQVLGGIKSKHDNSKEDRMWSAYVCDMKKKSGGNQTLNLESHIFGMLHLC